MDGKQKQNTRWLLLYKMIACVGICAVIAPWFDTLILFIARQYTAIATIALTALLLSLGYGIQLLFLGREGRKLLSVDMDFSYEVARIRLPRSRVIPACAVSAIISALLSVGVGRLLSYLMGNQVNTEIGIPLLVTLGAVLGCAGCLLVPPRFHQLVSLRTMVECIAAFTFLFAFYLWAGASVNFRFIVCVLLYFLCFTVLMNQEYAIRHSYTSPTCHATNALRRAGILSAVRFWLGAILFNVPILCALSLIVMPVQLILTSGSGAPFERVFSFPFKDLPTLNVLLFALGLLALIAGAILLLVRLCYDRKKLKELYARLVERLKQIGATWLLRLLGIYQRYRKGAPKEQEPPPPHYADTVTELAHREPVRRYSDYKAFYRQLKKCRSTNEQYRFAYRTLVTNLCDADIGLYPTQTPLEMAQIIQSKTNIPDIGAITDVFVKAAYADASVPVAEEELQKLCAVLQNRLD